jgi:hypothetical protein
VRAAGSAPAIAARTASIKFGSGTGNVIRGNRSFDNADDGFDLGQFTSPITVEYNWAYGNGVNRWQVRDWRSNADGFALGGGSEPLAVGHTVRHNAAWGNIHDGFTDSGHTGALQITNNTAYDNGSTGFRLTATTGNLTRNVAVDNGLGAALSG